MTKTRCDVVRLEEQEVVVVEAKVETVASQDRKMIVDGIYVLFEPADYINEQRW